MSTELLIGTITTLQDSTNKLADKIVASEEGLKKLSAYLAQTAGQSTTVRETIGVVKGAEVSLKDAAATLGGLDRAYTEYISVVTS